MAVWCFLSFAVVIGIDVLSTFNDWGAVIGSALCKHESARNGLVQGIPNRASAGDIHRPRLARLTENIITVLGTVLM